MFFNLERARGLMKQFGIDVLVASTPENVTYLSGSVSWSHKVYSYSVHMFGIFPRDEGVSPALVVPNQEATYLSAQNSWIKEHYAYGAKSALVVPQGEAPTNDEEATFLGIMNNDGRRKGGAAASLAQALKERGLEKARIALDGERILAGLDRQIREALPAADIVEGADLFRLIRMVKTPDELQAMRAAAALNERAATAASNAVAAGATEKEVATVYYTEVSRGGGRWHWYHFGSGRRSMAIFPPTHKKIQKGDMWVFDAGLTLNDYRADTGWGGVIGEPAKRQLQLWDASKAGYDAALSVVKAGVLPSQIFRAALKATQALLPGHDGRFCGHAIGLEARELPYVLADPGPIQSPFLPPTTDIPLEEGTTICVENPCRMFGVGGASEEQTLVVTRTGYEFLVPGDRKFWEIPA
ncbi:MAG: Xaa-Pro peptidase family protein [Nitrospinota bacterium]